MKIKLLLKAPDAIYESVREAICAELNEEDDTPGGAEFNRAIEQRMNELFAGPLAKWITYREYVSIEIDTEAGTASVCEASG